MSGAAGQGLESDRAWLDAFRRGEAAALTRLFQAHAAEVSRYLARPFFARLGREVQRVKLGPLDLADAHQETFIRAFAPPARSRYDGLRPYVGYLLGIARAAAVDLLRSQGKLAREARPLEDEEAQAARADAPSPEQDALSGEVRAVVARFLEGCDPADRALAALRFVEGLSQEVVGAQLGLTRAELRTRERRLRHDLNAHLLRSGWLGPSGAEVGELGVLLVAALGQALGQALGAGRLP